MDGINSFVRVDPAEHQQYLIDLMILQSDLTQGLSQRNNPYHIQNLIGRHQIDHTQQLMALNSLKDQPR